MTRKLPYLIVLLLTLFSRSYGAEVTFLPELDADADTNTSSPGTPYDADVSQTNAPAGIVDDDSTTTHSDTFYFKDAATTGIAFSFDVTWSATGGALNPTDASWLGVGSNTTIEGTSESSESITVDVGGLNVDLSGYVSGSVNGITSPVLDSSSVSFRGVTFNSFDATTEVIVTAGLDGQESFSSADDNFFVFPLGGLGTDLDSLLFSLSSGSIDSNFSLSATQFNVRVEISQVPEPSSFGIFCLATVACGGLKYCRRRRDIARSLSQPS